MIRSTDLRERYSQSMSSTEDEEKKQGKCSDNDETDGGREADEDANGRDQQVGGSM